MKKLILPLVALTGFILLSVGCTSNKTSESATTKMQQSSDNEGPASITNPSSVEH